MSGYSPPWSKKEIDFLRENYKKMTAREIAEELSKTIHAVKGMRRKLKLKKGSRYRWPEEKVKEQFMFIKRDINRTPTYNYLESNYPGLLTAVQRTYGNYNNFLLSLKIKPNQIQDRWNKENCIKEFQRIMKKYSFNEPPPIKRLNSLSPGILRAVYRHWGSYKLMLENLSLHPNFEKKWNKKNSLNDFLEFCEGYETTPTADITREARPDLLAAILKYHGSYNKLLLRSGMDLNQENWSKNRCVEEFQKLLKKENRTRQFSIKELYKKHKKLLAAIYRYFRGYNDFVSKLGYEPNYGFASEHWKHWEDFVIESCKQIYKKYEILIKKSIQNRKIPDITILKNGKIHKIIDAKMSVYCKGIDEDTRNYKPFCDILEFWCLLGKRKNTEKHVKFVTAKNIKSLLKKRKNYRLINRLSRLEGVWYNK